MLWRYEETYPSFPSIYRNMSISCIFQVCFNFLTNRCVSPKSLLLFVNCSMINDNKLMTINWCILFQVFYTFHSIFISVDKCSNKNAVHRSQVRIIHDEKKPRETGKTIANMSMSYIFSFLWYSYKSMCFSKNTVTVFQLFGRINQFDSTSTFLLDKIGTFQLYFRSSVTFSYETDYFSWWYRE